MRHLSTEELLLYAEGELDDPSLCQHVSDCVSCKARLVDLQETYVVAASAIQAHARDLVAQPAQLQRLRVRLAAEADLMQAHLTTDELLLSVENELDAAGREHLAACTACQDRAADLHLKLAEIEWELHAQLRLDVPAARRAAALVALRERLAEEVEARAAAERRPWSWVPRFTLPELPAFAPYAAAAAVVIAWIGWNAIPEPAPVAPQPVLRADAGEPAPAAAVAPAQRPQPVGESEPVAEAAVPARRPARFDWTAAGPPSPGPEAPARLAAVPSPRLPQSLMRQPVAIDFGIPNQLDPPAPPPPAPVTVASAIAVPPPARPAPVPQDAPEAVVEGSWLLAKAGLWREALEVGGSGGRIRVTGGVESERERADIERRLLAAADGRPLEFAIAVRPAAAAGPAAAVPTAGVGGSPSGGLVRTSLLRHYEDAARRSFQPLDSNRIEDDLDRYVSGVFRHDTELLAHVHALHRVLNRPGVEGRRADDSLQRLVRFHVQGIARSEAGIYDQLSEALPRGYWAYDGPPEAPAADAGLGDLSRTLLADALALDRALTAMFFGTREGLDARSRTRSSAALLLSVRQHARLLRSGLRRPLD